LPGGAGLGEAVGIGAGLEDVAAEGKAVDDGGAEAGSVKVLVQPLNDSLEAIATLPFSSRSVRTWKRSSAPRRSSSIPFEPEAANLFFQLVSRRYERASLIVTSNKPFG
jgi:hypothetical protein